MSKSGLIISGGAVNDVFALDVEKRLAPEVVIGVDSGLAFLYRNGVRPTHIVGDFDSISPEIIKYYKNETDIPVREYNPVKDATDTEIAVRLAVELGVDRLCILGATGSRLDHVMANIQILKIALDHGVEAWILDETNRISVHEKEIILTNEKQFGEYFSLFPLGEAVSDLSIEGAKYPLSHYYMSPYESRCVSNELIGQDVKITFPRGTVVLMETRD